MNTKTIAYYVSDYGFGHATRSIAVIRALFQVADQPYRLVICSSDTVLAFIKASLSNYREVIEYRQCISDVGYVLKPDSIEPDTVAFAAKYHKYMENLPHEAARESDFLRTAGVDLVISDISPIAFVAARHAEIPSVGISNFTWYTAYLEMIDHSALQPLFEVYAAMDYFVSLEGAVEPDWGRQGTLQADFFSREVDQQEVSRILHTINPGRQKRAVYFGIGMSINVQDLAALKLWEDDAYLFIVSSNMKVEHKNIIAIPASYTESQNYVAASDLVISKPGWSTVGEAVALRKPLLLLHRSKMKEDKNTILALQDRHPYRMIEWGQLKADNMQDFIDRENFFEDTRQRNGAVHIAEYLKQIVGSE
ncbi:glycosyl transferase family 28 [Paenibacillus sp. BK033]|uniref:glycosyltransferase n=1 Tax=Paenibacillus sp. BK033 TaxID=2512133 RepID=UPI00104BBD13|nr:glycosyltransferase [Paenibacillus sp. BK033]TCM92801.1 glycosyl transferase family 28 [Paenibacillus sp. BK033]